MSTESIAYLIEMVRHDYPNEAALASGELSALKEVADGRLRELGDVYRNAAANNDDTGAIRYARQLLAYLREPRPSSAAVVTARRQALQDLSSALDQAHAAMAELEKA